MAPRSPRIVIPVDVKRKPREEEKPLHNRCHPNIPPVAEVSVGELFRVEIVDWTGGRIGDNCSAEDVKCLNLSTVHNLSGPIKVVDEYGAPAKPCDLLVENSDTQSSRYAMFFIHDLLHFYQRRTVLSLECCEIKRGGMEKYLTPIGPTKLHVNPIFETGPTESQFSEWLVFEGISVDESGHRHYLDAIIAYKRAVLNVIISLSKFGYSREQVYLLLFCFPCEGRLASVVDTPNAVATIAIPTAIFDQDIRPRKQDVPVGPQLIKRQDVLKCTYDGSLPTTKS